MCGLQMRMEFKGEVLSDKEARNLNNFRGLVGAVRSLEKKVGMDLTPPGGPKCRQCPSQSCVQAPALDRGAASLH
jgi:hypothetical protein